MKDFNRGIKRDPNNFQNINNERHWSNSQDHTTATVNTQNMENVSDTTYVPTAGDARDLFDAQQNMFFKYLSLI